MERFGYQTFYQLVELIRAEVLLQYSSFREEFSFSPLSSLHRQHSDDESSRSSFLEAHVSDTPDLWGEMMLHGVPNALDPSVPSRLSKKLA
jgi:hypothetical protein